MRLVVVLSVMCLASCASEKLTQGPPSGVDFSGAWKLNEADSDDAQRLIAAQFSAPAPGNSQNTSPSGGQGGSRGGRGRDSIGGLNPGAAGPVIPPVSALNAGLRWPGRQLEIKQVAAVVVFTSDNANRMCQPGGRAHKHQADDDGNSSGRDTPSRRDPPPPHCTWEEKDSHCDGRRSRRRSSAVRREVQSFRRRAAFGGGGELQGRPLERIHHVARMGSGQIKKPGIARLLGPPCLFAALFSRSGDDWSFYFPRVLLRSSNTLAPSRGRS